jgi:GT2 family glycosyltransferase
MEHLTPTGGRGARVRIVDHAKPGVTESSDLNAFQLPLFSPVRSDADLLHELATIMAGQRDVLREIAADASSLAAIHASNSGRFAELIRRLKLESNGDGHLSGESSAPFDLTSLGLGPIPAVGYQLEGVLAAQRAELLRLEHEQRLLHHLLHVATHSKPRRIAIAVRTRLHRLGKLIGHPWWTARAMGNRIAGAPPLRGLRTTARRFRTHAVLCRFLAIESQKTDHRQPTDAIRWLPPIRMTGETWHALFCHPHAFVNYRVLAPGGARVVAACGLHPQVWNDNRRGVEFTIRARVPEADFEASKTLTVDPQKRWIDRRWHRLELRLPPGPRRTVLVTLETRLPAGSDGGHAWGVWGEPRIEWTKSPRDQVRSVKALTARLRQDGVRTTLQRLRRIEVFDEHAAQYRRWVDLNTPTDENLVRLKTDGSALRWQPLISIVTPVYNTDPRWLRACIESVRRQAYSNWELCLCDDGSTSKGTRRVLQEYADDPRVRVIWSPSNGGISSASNLALEQATGDFVALLDHDDELAPDALFEVVKLLNDKPDVDFVYSDEDKLDAAGERCDPYFKPDWSPEHFLSCMYTCHLMVVRRSLLRDIGGFRKGYEGAQDYDVGLRLMERTDRIHHIPKILYHWRKIPESLASSGAAKTWAMDAGERALQDYVNRRRLDAAVAPGAAPGLYRVRHRIKDRPLVSIVIPTAGRTREVSGQTIDLLHNCVRSIVEKSSYDNYEILIADNGTITDASRAYLEKVPHRRVTFRYSGQFNYSRKMNFGVSHSQGSHVVLFNDDIEVISPEWIEAMLEYSQQPEIGAVGAKLLYPDGRLQHIGIVMGVCGMAAHAFHSHPGSSPGYGSSALVVRNYSTVTAACMMTRRELYDRFEGFDEKFVFDFNDTDYCLRLRQAGYRVVFTPYAQLYHLEAGTTGLRKWDDAGLAEMRRRWTDVCEHDPYYNPNLTREYPDYRVRL